MGDIDGDGDIDLLADPYLFRSENGVLNLQPEFVGNVSTAMRLWDIDGDGDLTQ
ncbi:MAG: hypothetical protein R3F19_11135 [Verrucomicrobiales bacterium]